jgi:hypothetical protein
MKNAVRRRSGPRPRCQVRATVGLPATRHCRLDPGRHGPL